MFGHKLPCYAGRSPYHVLYSTKQSLPHSTHLPKIPLRDYHALFTLAKITLRKVDRSVAMPPTKTKLSKEHWKRHIDDYSINFEGPVPPKQWPTQYSHLFQVIRDIWANRYDEYIKRTDIDRKSVRKLQKRVRDLRTKASSLRADFGINEETWRSLMETPVMGRFDQEIVWSVLLFFLKVVPSSLSISVHCRKEHWESEYKAQPRNEYDKAKLETKREGRRQCTCENGDYSGRNLNEDR